MPTGTIFRLGHAHNRTYYQSHVTAPETNHRPKNAHDSRGFLEGITLRLRGFLDRSRLGVARGWTGLCCRIRWYIPRKNSSAGSQQDTTQDGNPMSHMSAQHLNDTDNMLLDEDYIERMIQNVGRRSSSSSSIGSFGPFDDEPHSLREDVSSFGDDDHGSIGSSAKDYGPGDDEFHTLRVDYSSYSSDGSSLTDVREDTEENK